MPDFGSFVKAKDEETGNQIIGVVYAATTAPIDSVHRARALGLSIEELREEQPQIFAMLKTEFKSIIVGYADPLGRYMQYLPPRPPQIHQSVYECPPEEVVAFSEQFDFLRPLLEVAGAPSDALTAAAMRTIYKMRQFDRDWLIAAGRNLSLILREDYDRLRYILSQCRVSGWGNFRGATTNLNASQNLQVIAHGEIDYRSNVATRGQFLSTGDFVANGNTNLYGTISSQQSVFLNGNTTITAVSTADTTPPSITVALINDTGSDTIDQLTKDAGIKGQVADISGIAEFKVQLDGSATTIDLKSKLQADGTFNLTDAQVRQLVGNLPDGIHSLAFSTKDTAGNQSAFSLSFILDTAAPLFTLTPLSIIKNDGKLVGQLTDNNLKGWQAASKPW